MEFSTNIGYGSRIKNAFAGVLMGIVLFFGSFVLHAFNERNAIRDTRAINEIEEVAIADVPTNEVDESKEGMLVHMNGAATTDDIVKNETFGIEENAIALTWESRILQTEEEKKTKDDRTVYSYSDVWSKNVIDSSGFKRQRDANNGSVKTLPPDDRDQARDVALGKFALNSNLVRDIGGEQSYPLTEVPPGLEDKGMVQGGTYWTGDASSPKIGDEKITFQIIRAPADVTVMAQQAGNGFIPYVTKTGKTKEILYDGLLSKEQVIDKQRAAAALRRWALRGLGFLLMWIGLRLIAKPISAMVSFIPFASRLANGVTGVIAFLIAACLSLVSIAVIWFAFRPLLSAVLLVGAAVCVFGAITLKRKRDATRGIDVGADPVPAYDGPRPPPPPSN